MVDSWRDNIVETRITTSFYKNVCYWINLCNLSGSFSFATVNFKHFWRFFKTILSFLSKLKFGLYIYTNTLLTFKSDDIESNKQNYVFCDTMLWKGEKQSVMFWNVPGFFPPPPSKLTLIWPGKKNTGVINNMNKVWNFLMVVISVLFLLWQVKMKNFW